MPGTARASRLLSGLIILPIIVMALLIVSALAILRQVNANITTIYDDRMVSIQQLKRVNDAYAIYIIDAVNRAHAGTIPVSQALTIMRRAQQIAALNWQAYKKTQITPQEEVLTVEAERRMAKAEGQIQRVAQVMQGGGDRAKLAAFDGPLYTVIDPITAQIDRLVELQLEVANQNRQQAYTLYEDMRFWFVLVGLASGVILFGMGYAISRLIQALQRANDTATALQQQMDSVLTNIPQMLWAVEIPSKRILYVSPASLYGDGRNMNGGGEMPCMGWTSADDQEQVAQAWQRALNGEQAEVETCMGTLHGVQRWLHRAFHPYRDDAGRVVRIDGVMEDITELKAARDRLQSIATTDALTGLPNRVLWNDRVTQAIATARREQGQLALMLLDLNHFKVINDTLGHAAGDAVLRQVAQRLKSILRETDTLARLGGDEFAVLLPDIGSGQANAEHVARQVLECFAEPLHDAGNEFYVSTSIGIALFPGNGEDADALLRHADVAMYAAKHSNAGYLFYDSQTDTNTSQRLQLSGDLRHAIQRGELALYFQPKMCLTSRRITGVEALIRWRHPQYGLLLPANFIPLAEQTGLISTITDWVLDSAMAQIKRWQSNNVMLPVAVNISPVAFRSPKLVERIARALDAAGLSGDMLELEITENVLMPGFINGQYLLHKLNDLNVSIAIDDFGTGYSSLAYLKQLPIDTIKIDQSFVRDMATDKNGAAIVRSTIDLGHALGFKVVAEGVENGQTLDALAQLGCDFVQGYHICDPLPADTLARWMTALGAENLSRQSS